jgi:hypothetical protein
VTTCRRTVILCEFDRSKGHAADTGVREAGQGQRRARTWPATVFAHGSILSGGSISVSA